MTFRSKDSVKYVNFVTKKAPGGHFENVIDVFREPNLQLVNTLLLAVIWGLCDLPFRRYGQIREFCDEKRHLAAILKVLFDVFRLPKFASCQHASVDSNLGALQLSIPKIWSNM